MIHEKWECPCGAQNPAGRDTCRACGTSFERASKIKAGWDPSLEEEKKYDHIQISTTSEIPGHRIIKNHGIITAQAVLGAHFLKDLEAGLRDIFGGRSSAYEKELKQGSWMALRELKGEADKVGANGIVGVRLDYETVGSSMLMIIAQGTAVKVEAVSG